MDSSTKLDPDLKQKWVEALRSGKYIQGKQYLKRFIDGAPRYCCLGVLGEICQLPEEDLLNKGFLFLNPAISLPISLVGQSGLSFLLADMNDQQNKSFSEIADYIQENL